MPRPWNRTNNASWNARQRRAPAHLKGREIGLYYKERYQSKSSQREDKKEHMITLKIPPVVETHVLKNLQSIRKIAKILNVYIAPAILSNLKQNVEKINAVTSLTLDNDGIELCTNTEDNLKAEIICIDDCEQSDFKMDTSISEDQKPNQTGYQKHEKINAAPSTSSVTKFTPFQSTVIKQEQSESEPSPCSSSKNDFIPLQSTSKNENVSKFDTTDYTTMDFIPLKSKNATNFFKPKPSSSSAPDFIPVACDKPDDFIMINNGYGSGERIMALRGGGDYKYSYEDIITGTFDEKLEECISKGISINSQTDEIKAVNEYLHEEYKKMTTKSGYRKLLKFREILPTYKKADEVLKVIENNQVVVISGETGCGKSTQVPQLILDHAICNNKGGNVKILVTQPRRIAASSLAARVAQERAEKVGESVGYAVRLDKVESRPRGSIMFCTTGILLVDLEVNQALTGYSHVILDEVHERDCHIDLSMCMLKKVLKKRKDLKLILMSATIDAEKLCAYFDDCPMLHIEGLAYPVKDIYLEDILQQTKFYLDEPKQRNEPKWVKYKNKAKQNKTMEQEIQYRAEIGPWLESIKHKLDKQVYQTLQDFRVEELSLPLVCEVLLYICQGPPGAILVFLPGIGEISKLMKLMNESRQFPDALFEIHPLHSKLPSLDQHKIFERPLEPVRKIIIATNIAETSITIDDIVYVLDCGKMKLSGLNVEENVSTLKTECISQANLRQRRGRAGRCQPGVCYHLMTSYRASVIPERVLPELQRSNLLEPLLTIKRLRLGMAADALSAVPSPPAESTVKWAVKHLQQCGGLDDKETLTPLGWHLARLPVHPSAGKLLLLGALFGCLDRAASVAVVWGFKDPFQIVIGKEVEVDEAKRKFALGEPSDHIAISEAIMQWERCPRSQRRSFSYDNFLSYNTVELLSEMKMQLGDSLRQMGFLATGDVKSAWENRNAQNLSLFKAIVAASLYPNIGTVRWLGGRQGQRIKVFAPEHLRPVMVHPSSVMVGPKLNKGPIKLCNNPGANWLVYWLKQKSSDLFLFEVTLVYTLPLLFFGELKVSVNEQNQDECFMFISNLKVRCNKRTAEILFELRAFLDQVLASKVMVSNDHSTKQNDFEECVLSAVTELITAEDEQVEYLGND